MEEVEAWRNRPLQSFYPLLSSTASTYQRARVWRPGRWLPRVMLAYDVNGRKDVLGLWINETESKHASMQIHELPGLAARRSWHPGSHGWRERVGGRRQGCIPHATVQQRIITPHPQFHPLHPTQAVECIPGQPEAHLWCHQRQAGRQGIREVQDRPAGLSGAVSVWENNFSRRDSITMEKCRAQDRIPTNAIESVNSSFRKVTKKGAFPTRMQSSRFSTYASKSSIKWKGHHVANWAMVRTSCSWTTGCLSLCSNTMLLIESIYTKLLTHPYPRSFFQGSP